MCPPASTSTPGIVTHQFEMSTQAAPSAMLASLHSGESLHDTHADKLCDVCQMDVRRKRTDAITTLEVHASDETARTLTLQPLTRNMQSLRRMLLSDRLRRSRAWARPTCRT